MEAVCAGKVEEKMTIPKSNYFMQLNPQKVYDFAFNCYKNSLEILEIKEMNKDDILSILDYNFNGITNSLQYFGQYFKKYLMDESDVINKKKIHFINRHRDIFTFRKAIHQKILDLKTNS